MAKFLYIQNECDSNFRKDLGPNDVFTNTDKRTTTSTSNGHRHPDYQRGIDHNMHYNYRVLEDFENETDDLWFHFRMNEGFSACQIDFFPEGERKGSNRAHFMIFGTSSSNLGIYVEKGSSVEIYGETVIPTNQRCSIDVKINITSGAWAAFVNENKVGEGTNSSIATLDASDFKWWYNDSSNVSSGAAEVIITQGIPTLGMRLIELPPEALGTSTDLTGNLSDVQSITLTEAGMSTDAAGSQTFTYEDIKAGVDLTDMEVRAVSINTIASADELFEDNFGENVIKIGGTEYKGKGSIIDTASDALHQKDIMEINPATGAAWTIAEINALEAGFSYSAPPVGRMIVADSGTYFGYADGFAGEFTSISTDKTAGNALIRCNAITASNVFTIRFDTDTKFDNANTVTVRLVSEDGTEASATVTFATIDYSVTDPAITTWLQGQLGKLVKIYVTV
ncbi:hypothetical protein SM033_00047 [Vibrio phage vB_VpaM_sm033]|nr:hypothetical protein SM033_00047 [Vibrio phage vB_VpaM_sm033]